MKRIKKLAVVLATVTALVLLPEANALTSKAEEPVTYSVKYVSDNLGWRFQVNTSTFDTSNNGLDMYNFPQYVKDGDLVVIYNEIGTTQPLDLGDVNLSNLTYVKGTKATIVYAASVTDCYVLDGTTGTINCDVKNAYVYDTVTFNFNNNVSNLYLYAEGKIKSNLAVVGTVDHLLSTTLPGREPYSVHFNYYDFPSGSLRFSNGIFTPKLGFKTPEEHAQLISSTETSSTADDEYDDVPQTGQSYLYLWFFCASIICFATSIILKRTSLK